jgi:exodeoxyribonuclease-5
MKWSPQQKAALKKARAWVENPEKQQVFYLAGYAGTGKSTLARHLAEGVQGRVLYGAYTGKAALVMKNCGCTDATTIHRMIYLPKDKSTRRLTKLKRELIALKESLTDDQDFAVLAEIEEVEKQLRVEKKNLKQPAFDRKDAVEVRRASLIIIDECSMVGERMGQDLLSFDIPILVLGDPAQLPPIRSGGFFTNRKPDAMLTEIHRQAESSPVLQLATMIRQGDRPQLGEYGSSRVVPKGVLSLDDLLDYDQVLVGRNRTRKDLNAQIRKAIGRKDLLPEEGDKLICLRNDHDLGLMNGSLWTTVDRQIIDDDTMILVIRDENRDLTVEAHRHYIEDREDDLSHWAVRDAQCFDYGYAITTHKAQGSQWNDVLVIDESRDFKQDEMRWLYTATTRAAKSITIVDKNGYVTPLNTEATPW